MASKYEKYVHRLHEGPHKGRFIVCHHDDDKGWVSTNTQTDPGGPGERTADTPTALAGKFIRTYAGIGAAAKAARRIYDLDRKAEAA